MVGVLKIEQLHFSATPGGIRQFLKEGGVRPQDIHLVLDPNGKHNGSAFLIFTDFEEAKHAMTLNGKPFRGRNISLRQSNPPEFNRVFPGVAMLTKPKGFFRNNRDFKPGYSGNMSQLDRKPFGRNGQNIDENRRGDRGRSRSPVGRRDFDRRNSDRREPDRREPDCREMSRRFPDRRGERSRPNSFNNRQPPNIDKNKYLQLPSVSLNVTEFDVQNFFRPLITREIHFMRNNGGRFGNIIICFFSESDAREGLKMNGRRLGSRSATVLKARKEDIMQVLHMDGPPLQELNPPQAPLPDLMSLNAVANANPQVQQLLHLLTATVNSLAGAAAATNNQQNYQGRESFREQRPDTRRDNRDPVISRVANSAKIDVDDINMGRVVGIRNLPYSVTPDEVLKFFRGFHAIPDSVRIHYLEDGRCSGDAIVSFQGKKDARKAVSTLNKQMVGRRRVELFFL